MDETLQKQIAKNVLQEYVKIENNITNNYQYYCHTEFDGSVTEFEGLSNSNKIVLKSRLNIKYIPIIMSIFQNIYDKNYWHLSENGFLDDSFTGYDLVNDERFEILSSSTINLEEWLKFLDELSSNYKVSTSKRNSEIEDERIYETIPDVEASYFPQSKKSQKVYTLQDIIDLINF